MLQVIVRREQLLSRFQVSNYLQFFILDKPHVAIKQSKGS